MIPRQKNRILQRHHRREFYGKSLKKLEHAHRILGPINFTEGKRNSSTETYSGSSSAPLSGSPAPGGGGRSPRVRNLGRLQLVTVGQSLAFAASDYLFRGASYIYSIGNRRQCAVVVLLFTRRVIYRPLPQLCTQRREQLRGLEGITTGSGKTGFLTVYYYPPLLCSSFGPSFFLRAWLIRTCARKRFRPSPMRRSDKSNPTSFFPFFRFEFSSTRLFADCGKLYACFDLSRVLPARSPETLPLEIFVFFPQRTLL